MTNYGELRAKAEKATPGQWMWTQPGNQLIATEVGITLLRYVEFWNGECKSYIAAANPQTILGLLAEREADKARIAALEADNADLHRLTHNSDAENVAALEARIAELEGNQEWLHLAKHQPCGCVVCTCENDVQCGGCGAKRCGKADCVLEGDRSKAVWVNHPLVERAERAESELAEARRALENAASHFIRNTGSFVAGRAYRCDLCLAEGDDPFSIQHENDCIVGTMRVASGYAAEFVKGE